MSYAPRYDEHGRRRRTPSDLRREANRRGRRAAGLNHAEVTMPGSTPRLGPPIRRRTAKGGGAP